MASLRKIKYSLFLCEDVRLNFFRRLLQILLYFSQSTQKFNKLYNLSLLAII